LGSLVVSVTNFSVECSSFDVKSIAPQSFGVYTVTAQELDAFAMAAPSLLA